MSEACGVYSPLTGGPRLRWGIAAPGGIARDFASTLLKHTDQRLVAVASRSRERAEHFGRLFSVERCHDDYDALFASDVDVVYIASVNAHHVELALRAISAGKHVLIEKPLGVDAGEVSEVAAAARAAGVLAMEAMWVSYLPAYVELRRRLEDGALGDVRTAGVELGWRSERGDGSPIWNADLGGGVLLDRGVYGFWFACSTLGWPSRLAVLGTEIDGVDAQVVAAAQTVAGRSATVTLTLEGTSSGHGELVGTAARAEIAGHVVFAEGFDIVSGSDRAQWRDRSGLAGREGLAWQAAALARFVDEGLTDSPVHGLGDSFRLAQVMDAARTLVNDGGGVVNLTL